MTNEHKTRKVDYYGKVMIPKNIRVELNINYGDELHIYYDENGVYFKKGGEEQ